MLAFGFAGITGFQGAFVFPAEGWAQIVGYSPTEAVHAALSMLEGVSHDGGTVDPIMMRLGDAMCADFVYQ